MDSEETLPALQDERSVMSFFNLDAALDGRPMEGVPVLEPLEHSVLEMALDGGPLEEMSASVLEPLEHSVLDVALDGRPMEGIPVLEPLEHSVLEMALNDGPTAGISVLEPLEHSFPDVALDWDDRSLIKMAVSDPLEPDDVDLDPLWMAPWDAGGTLGTGSRPGIAIWRDVLCCVSRLSRMPVLPVTGYLRSFRGLGWTCILDANAGESKAPVRMMRDERVTDFPRPQFPPCGARALPSNSHSPGHKCTTDLGFPWASHTPGEKCAAELDFPRASLTPGECCAEELGYIRPALLVESPVYAWTVTGSLLFGSPHRRVRGCFRSTLLCHPRVDGLVTLNCRFPPAIITSVLISTGSGLSFHWACAIAHWERDLNGHDRSKYCRCRQCLVPPGNLTWIVLAVIYLSHSFLSSGRLPAMDQVGTSSVSSAPLSGTFLGLALDLRSDKLHDLVQDIPDVMGLRALRPSMAIVKVMSVPDSRCIRVVTPDDHVNIGFHEVLLHDMEDEDLPFVALSELNCLRLD